MVAMGNDRAEQAGSNADYPWDEFDPEDYFAHNYAELRDDDRQILQLVREYFADQLGDVPMHSLRGIDVGTGANLYPAMSMLPFSAEITLYEFSPLNVKWLSAGQENRWEASWPSAWAQFWKLFAERDVYARVTDPRDSLADRSRVVQGSVFDLKPAPGERWDLGTMFFVAESITRQEREFSSATDHFLNALKPGAPFAIAFMEHSTGYPVAGRGFPSTNIGVEDVRNRLRDRVSDVSISHIGLGDKPLRDGYQGMILARGRVSNH
jgi:hypothetical protein